MESIEISDDLENDEQFLSGGGQMGALIRSMDWSATALGPTSQWPQSLRTSVSLCLSSTFPILIAWGPELIQIYNDSYRPICGAKHPESMGQNFKICWETALPVVGDAFDRGLAGEGTYIKDQQMLLDRYGYIEEAFMTFSFAPIRDESGNVGGIFHPITETTDQILSSRRTQVLRELAIRTGNAKTFDEIYKTLDVVQSGFSFDVPFLQVYEISEDGSQAILKSSAGVIGEALRFPIIRLEESQEIAWPFLDIQTDEKIPFQVQDLSKRYGIFQSGPFEKAPHTALIFPIVIAGNERPYGYLVVGVSSARLLDQEYQSFFELFANTISTSFSNVDAYQQQQKRAQQLAEIDRAKTAFFSNVSHEFRTPLTLILGPLQQMIDEPDTEGKLSLENRDAMYRNAQRLLKLVNNLLDFSRLEAGRVKAAFQKIPLGILTADLASNFRSVIESAGMELIIETGGAELDVFVDTDMWEKIVLNLLSNAFKYTLHGKIAVFLTKENNFAVLQVSDTGVGIQASELPHMFERFHRIENSEGRTHEGSGIGLSLVAELVNLHGGEISVESIFGEGSTFTIKIPLGNEHLPKEQIIAKETSRSVSTQQQTFIREAMSLLDPDESNNASAGLTEVLHDKDDQSFEINQNICVMVVDDNADMRSYLKKILTPYFRVEVAVNGREALLKLDECKPDVIVSDVMMPVMDGKQLLSALRLRTEERIPVILLSARAGEESRVEGLKWGADDYLVKPFSARELFSKISSIVKINEIGKKTEAELRNIFLQAPVAIGIFRGPQQIIEVANTMMLRYWGRTSQQVVGLPFAKAFENIPQDGFDLIAKEVFETGQRKVLRDWQLDVVRKEKAAKLYINVVLEPLHDLNGAVTGVMVVANDVTELVTALELVQESEQRFKILANTMPQLIWLIEVTGRQNFYNDFTYKYSGLTPQELLGKGMIELIHPDEREHNLLAWNQSISTGEDFTYEHRFRRYDGQYRWHLSRATAQRNSAGLIENWVGASTDIHDQKVLEEILESKVLMRTAELNLINEQLVQTNRELEQFAHVTSHDLQEPLRKIRIFSNLIYNNIDESDKTTHDYLRRITASAERMSELIRDLLNFARVSDSELNFTAVDLNQVVEKIKLDFEYLIQEKKAHILSDLLPVIDAVPLQMNQLFSNLLGNALKFSGDGARIEIGYERINYSQQTLFPFLKPDIDYVLITIEDNGIGFDQQFAERIFTIFQRLHGRHDYPGTGIGLSICKKIVENHAGFIKAKGEKGKGASFELFIPSHRKI